MDKGIDMINGYNNLVTLLAACTADALGVTLGTKLVDKLIREATEIVVMDWCEFDYDKDAEWLDLIASVEADWQVASIQHRNGVRIYSITSNLAQGYSFSQILAELNRRLERGPLPAGTRLELGGDLLFQLLVRIFYH